MVKSRILLTDAGKNMGLIKKAKQILEMIKFEHTIFALPFAYLGMVLGARGFPDFYTFFWITLAMVGARSFSMALNRLFDLNLDKKNPRTSGWPLSRGIVTVKEAIILSIASVALFILSVYMLPSLCHRLWPFVLMPMAFYSFTKRFTCFCHLFLGLCLGLAPIGAWVATTNSLPSPGIYSLGLAVLFWTAGFDIIYSCQDYSFDKNEGIHSFPVHFGIKRALTITKLFHLLAIILLIILGKKFSFGIIYYTGIMFIAFFLWYENKIISHDDLTRVNVSFFTLNGIVSIFTFILTFLSIKIY